MRNPHPVNCITNKSTYQHKESRTILFALLHGVDIKVCNNKAKKKQHTVALRHTSSDLVLVIYLYISGKRELRRGPTGICGYIVCTAMHSLSRYFFGLTKTITISYSRRKQNEQIHKQRKETVGRSVGFVAIKYAKREMRHRSKTCLN